MKNRRIELGITVQDIAESLNISVATVYRYEKGDIEKVPGKILEPLAKILQTTPAYLMGWEDDPSLMPKSAMPVGEMVNLPVLGRVCAGYGCLAQQEILYYEPADARYATGEYFYLLVSGDSMAPEIKENDLVLVKSQTSVDSGDLAVVIVDGTDGVIKKVVYDKTHIHLISFNPYYPERVFENSEVLRIRIVGKVIKSERKW